MFLSAHGFEPHRHDVYAVGITTAGVQTFRYRGSRRICHNTTMPRNIATVLP